MPAGTITLTNNSTAVTGSGTAFPTELKANDFLVAIVGGTTYTLGVKSVESATALILTTVYGGPTTGGLAWTPIPNGTLVGITAQIAADTARAIRGLNYDKQNWQQVYSTSGNITVTLPDGSTYTGSSWSNISSQVNNKAAKGANSDITSLSGLTTALSITQGGTGSKSPFGSAANTFCQGNDSRLGTVNGKAGGNISSNVTVVGSVVTSYGAGFGVGANGNYRVELNAAAAEPVSLGDLTGWTSYRWYTERIITGAKRGGGTDLLSFDISFSSGANFSLNKNGNGTASGSWVPNSDVRLKDKIARIENPLEKMNLLKGCTWMRIDTGKWGIGFIAQDVAEVFPEAVYEGDDRKMPDGSVVEKVLSPDTYGVSAALHHEAILALMDKVAVLESIVQEMREAH
jgi:hypothetical protein